MHVIKQTDWLDGWMSVLCEQLTLLGIVGRSRLDSTVLPTVMQCGRHLSCQSSGQWAVGTGLVTEVQ